MATTLLSQLNIDARASSTKDGGTGGGSIIKNRALTNGTSADQADKAYYKLHTIAYSSVPENLDFAGGGLIDTNGDTITWVEMVGLIVYAPATNTDNVLVGAGSNPLNFGCGANSISIMPGETKVLINAGVNPAYPIAAGSTDNLKLATAAGINQVLEILAFGRSS